MFQNIKNLVRPVLTWYAQKLTPETERAFWLVMESALKFKYYLASLFTLNVLSALLEGSTVGLMVLAVDHIVNTSSSNTSLEQLGMAGEWLAALSLQWSKEFFFLFLISLAVGGQLVRFAMVIATTVISSKLGMVVTLELQGRMIRQIMSMSYPQINVYKRGEIAAFVGQSSAIASLMKILNDLMANLLIIGTYIALMFWISWHMTLVGFIAALVYSVGITFIFTKIKLLSKINMWASLAASHNSMELLHAPKLLRVYAKEKYAEKRMLDTIWEVQDSSRRSSIWKHLISPLSDAFTVLIGGATLIGGFFFLTTVIDNALPTLLGFVLVMNRLMSRVTVLNGARSAIATALPSAQMFSEVMRTDNKSFTQQDGEEITRFEKSVRFEDVSFTYPKTETEVVTDVSFTINHGEMVAFVGSSGAGKSTISDLLLGLYKPSNGNIYLDDHKLSDTDERSWRSLFGVVTQENSLLNLSVRDNITFSKPDATDEEVHEAALTANALEFIEGLEDGMDTRLGDQGYRLSGGQIQRIALARAVLPKPPLLLLDEATSALDTVSERKITDAIDAMKGSTTMIIIAHRLSTIMNADRILVLDKGTVVEQGSHRELLELNGLYANLWHLQTKSRHDEETHDQK